MDDSSVVDILHTFQKAFNDLAGLKIRELSWIFELVGQREESLELASGYQFHLDYDELLIFENTL